MVPYGHTNGPQNVRKWFHWSVTGYKLIPFFEKGVLKTNKYFKGNVNLLTGTFYLLRQS